MLRFDPDPVRGTAPRYVSPTGTIRYMKSDQEVTIAHALDAEPLVTRWFYEKKSVVYDYKKKLRTYYLDFMVFLQGGLTLHLEIKPPGYSPSKMDRAKWAEAREVLGDSFLVVEALEEDFAKRWIEEHTGE